MPILLWRHSKVSNCSTFLRKTRITCHTVTLLWHEQEDLGLFWSSSFVKECVEKRRHQFYTWFAADMLTWLEVLPSLWKQSYNNPDDVSSFLHLFWLIRPLFRYKLGRVLLDLHKGHQTSWTNKKKNKGVISPIQTRAIKQIGGINRRPSSTSCTHPHSPKKRSDQAK